MSMSYANMIDEKNMKKTFILATLISTVVGTFTTSVGLYDRLADRRKQEKTDATQDSKIRELEKQIQENEKRDKKDDRRRDDVRREDLEYSLEKSGPQIQRFYDANLKRLGSQFAIGDTVTQNEVQSQIITLQQAVINVLQNAVMTGREILPADINKLYLASEAARDGSMQALQQQQQRLLTGGPMQQPLTPPMTPISPIQQSYAHALPPAQHSHAHGFPPAQHSHAHGFPPAQHAHAHPISPVNQQPHAHALPTPSVASTTTTVAAMDTAPLFCRYSHDLQRNPSMPLSRNFWPGGDNGCPACGVRLAIEQGRAWKITREVEHVELSTRDYDDVVIEERAYSLSNRFVIKCHRENGEFACVLCNANKDKDTLLDSVNGLVRHVWRSHDISEYNREMDIRPV